MSRFPALNPLIYVEAICSSCGKEMERSIERGPMNRVEKIVYTCINGDSGCSYSVESDQRLSGMCMPVKKHANG